MPCHKRAGEEGGAGFQECVLLCYVLPGLAIDCLITKPGLAEGCSSSNFLRIMTRIAHLPSDKWALLRCSLR